MFTFDPTVTLGTLIQILVFFGLGLIAFVRVQGKLDVLSLRVKNLETTTENAWSIPQQVAVQSQRLAALEDDVRGLRRGEGWITRRDGIDGEYS